MADKRSQRQKKTREKQRKRREAKQKERRQLNRASRGGLSDAVRWPVGDCYLSQHWHEQGAHVHAAFVRTHASGRSAVALCEVDLATRGLIDCKVMVVDSEDHVRGLISERSEPYAMLDTAPELVVKVIVEGAVHGRAAGFTPPRTYAKAQPLFAGVDPADSPHELLLGEGPPEPEEKPGWFSRLLGG